MTVTSLTSYIPRIMINTPLFPQRNAADTKIICNVQEMIHFSQSILTLSHKPWSRHHRVLWSPESIFNDFDIKQSLMFYRGEIFTTHGTLSRLCCCGQASVARVPPLGSPAPHESRQSDSAEAWGLGCFKKAPKKGI